MIALTAPVRLRSVASGLMIEKVRSIAMFSSLQNVGGELPGLYRRSHATASDPVTRLLFVLPRLLRFSGADWLPARPETARRAANYSNFTKVNPV
jgi:hypothetical protein